MSFDEEQSKDKNLEPTGEFGRGIGDFRSVLTHLSAKHSEERGATVSWLAPARRRQRRHHQHLVLGWACAAVLCAATTLPLMLHSHGAVARPAVQTTATAISSEAPQTGLLEQVDEDVSESVPSSLAPLTEIDNWNSASASSDDSSLTTENTNAAH